MAVYGHISEFSLDSEDVKSSWEEYCERLTQYFIANGVGGDDEAGKARQRAIFLSSVGAETYSLVKTLCLPDKPETKSLAQLQKVVKDHLSPAPIVIAERYVFYNRRQQSGEAAAQFMKELKRLAGTCEFHADYRDDVIRDMFVIGLNDREVQRKLLSRDKLTAIEAFQVAQASERAKSQVEVISAEVHRTSMQVSSHKSTSHKPSAKKSDRPCFLCGSREHWKADCPQAKTKPKGYKQNQKYRKASLNVNRVDGSEQYESDSEVESVASLTKVVRLGKVETVKAVRKVPEFMVEVGINGQVVSMELDTGSSVSLMSHCMYRTLWPQSKLKTSDIVLNTITGQPINVIGKTNVSVTYHEAVHADLCLFVVETTGPPLLGRDWLTVLRLDWAEIKAVKDLSAEQVTKDLKSKFKELFDGSLGRVSGVEATLELKEEAKPRFFKPRPVPFAVQQSIAEELEAELEQGILRRVDYSDWASPIVALKKPSGAWRICGDFKVTINKFLKIPEHPMPKVDELLAKLNGGQSFSKLDLSQAYLQIPLDKESQKLVAINTHIGLFTYTRVPYGISAAPAYFQSIMDRVLQGLNCGCYLDDIVVTGKDTAEHLKNLTAVMERLKQHGFRLQEKKCEFFSPSIKYLGQIVDKNGVRIDGEATTAIAKAPRPANKDEVRSFLGLVSHYRKFVSGMSTVCAPLNRLLEKNRRWEWNQQCEEAFCQVKHKLCSDENLLAHYNPDQPLILSVDASPVGLGAVISHEDGGQDKPVAFASRSLTAAERNYAQIDREALAIVFGVKRFHQYLYGRKFVLWTDNKPLSHIVSMEKGIPSMAAARIQRWCLQLAAYNYDVRHRAGSKQGNVDALSRLPMEGTSEAVNEMTEEAAVVNRVAIESMPVTAKQIARETRKDPVFSRVLEFAMQGWPEEVEDSLKPFSSRKEEISIEEGCLLWGTRVLVPEKFRCELLSLLHEQHPGIVRMKSIARLHCWWPNLDREIEAMVRACGVCQKSLPLPKQLVGNNWAWPTKPWQRLHVDFAQYKEDHYLVMVDAHSKWPEVIHMRRGTSAVRTIEAYREVFARLGIPKEICSDNGPPFPSAEMEEFMTNNGIKQIFSPPYHPKSNGEAERFVRTLKEGIRRRVGGSVSHNLGLNDFLLTYRTTPHSTTGRTPSEMLYGRRIRTKLDLIKPDLGEKILRRQTGDKVTDALAVGERVITQDYRDRRPKWIEGVVTDKLSPVTYLVDVGSSDKAMIWKRHQDQLRVTEGDWNRRDSPLEAEADECLTPTESEDPRNLHEPTEDVRASGEPPRPCAEFDVGPPRRSTRRTRRPAYLQDYCCD